MTTKLRAVARYVGFGSLGSDETYAEMTVGTLGEDYDYVKELFNNQGIDDAETFNALDDANLREIGVAKMGHRNLTAANCGAWTDLWDVTNGPGWHYCHDQASRLDPCSCDRAPAPVTCSASHITQLYVRARGSAPAQLGRAYCRLHEALCPKCRPKSYSPNRSS